MKVREICEPSVMGAVVDEMLTVAASRMRTHGVGALAVYDHGDLVGIITERDLVRAIVDGVDPKRTQVAAYMTPGPVTVPLGADAEDAATTMIRLGARHLPVVEHGQMVGMVSARDLLRTGPQVKARSKARGA